MKLQRLLNKVCLVTGSGRGIGRNIAFAMGREGCIIALADIDSGRLDQVQAELSKDGIAVDTFASDLSLKGESHRLIQSVVNKFGRIDILVNNARGGKRLSFADESEDNWDLSLGVNLKSVFFLSQAVVSAMPDNGAIINIGSISGQLVSSESPSYQISKAGILQLTRYLAVNSGGVRVNSVLPGFIVQDEHRHRYESNDSGQVNYRMVTDELHPLGRGPGYSDDIANVVVFLASDEAKFINGQAVIVDGGLSVQDPTKVFLEYALAKYEA